MVREWIAWVEFDKAGGPEGEFDWDRFARNLNAGLVGFCAGAAMGGDFLPTNLFAACCLQLQNLIVEVDSGVPLRRCHNARCGRAFLRQHDTPERSRHRSQVMYCSLRCSRAQANREYKRRKREQS